jgi:hypothetical protein
MGRWRAKFVTTLVVYGAGFLTAIYFMGPGPESSADVFKLPEGTSFDRERLLRKVNSGLHSCVDLGKEAANHVAVVIREYRESESDPN